MTTTNKDNWVTEISEKVVGELRDEQQINFTSDNTRTKIDIVRTKKSAFSDLGVHLNMSATGNISIDEAKMIRSMLDKAIEIAESEI